MKGATKGLNVPIVMVGKNSIIIYKILKKISARMTTAEERMSVVSSTQKMTVIIS